MSDLQYEFLLLGQDLMDHVEDHPEQAPHIVARLRRELEQIKSGIGHKSIEGTSSSTNQGRENIMETISVQTATGSAVDLDMASFQAAMRAAGVLHDGPSPSNGNGPAVQVVKEKDQPLLTKSEVRVIERTAEARRKEKYDMRTMATDISYDWIRLAGKLLLVVGAVTLGIYVVNAVFRPGDQLPLGAPPVPQ